MEFAEIIQAILNFLTEMWDVILFSLVGLAMVFGWFGMLVPMFPGGAVMWVAALLTGINFGFGFWGWVLFGIISVLIIVLFFVDDYILIKNAREEGLPIWLIFVSMFLGLILTFVFTPMVGIFTPPTILFIYEYIRKREFNQALKIFTKIFAGLGVTLFYRFGAGFVIIILWGIWMVIVI